MAHARPLRRDLLPQRDHLLRRRDQDRAGGPLPPDAAPRGLPLSGPLGVAGRRGPRLCAMRPHGVPARRCRGHARGQERRMTRSSAARPGTGRGAHQSGPLPAPKVAPRSLPGFDAIHRFWDGNTRAWTAQILPGEFYVTRTPNEIITTVLGSCVAACIRDPVMGVGGMNHFMLPEAPGRDLDGSSTRYGGYAI